MKTLTWIIGWNQCKHRSPYGKETERSQRRRCVKTEAKMRKRKKEREREGGKSKESVVLEDGGGGHEPRNAGGL